MKSICALVHRPDRDRAFFQRYYEQHHAPLAARLFPFRGYARNHVDMADGFGWDTISEFWVNDPLAPQRVIEGPHAAMLRADEDRFLDRTRLTPARVEEHVLSSGDPADADGRRLAVLLKATADALAWGDPAMAWGRDLARRRSGVVLDILIDRTSGFPADAVLWLAGHDDPGPPPDGIAARLLRMHRHETDMTTNHSDFDNEGHA
ncbi:EthD domain-containing protein [Novosphingobium sp. BL-8H]|uniref:EthD domain-containing protein n=1 Tax=Novosphingobium sp. BL-8H TaxID=3127640 RepID=UPI003756C383